VSLARIIRWEVGPTGGFDRPRIPEEIMDKLEERVGPEGRKLFEQFLKKVNRLQERQQASGVAARRDREGARHSWSYERKAPLSFSRCNRIRAAAASSAV
jgi:hypothetical protein